MLAALRGLRVPIVEKGEWGGCCLNRGCVPKKTWYHSARLISASRGCATRGIEGTLRGDLSRAWRHQREVVAQVRASYTDDLQRLGVRLIEGTARFVDRRTVGVAGERVVADHAIVATGSEPFIPANLPRCRGRILTTDDLFNAEPPAGKRVAVVGSGVIGTEFAFILSMLGKEVVWLMQRAPLSRSAYSVPARTALMAALAEAGISRPHRQPRRIGGRRWAGRAAVPTGRRAGKGALELARVGLNEDAAEARGLEPAVGFTAFDTSPAALGEGDASGFVRILAKMDSGRLLGAEIVGAEAGELVHLIGLEFGSEDALRRLAAMAYNHPARAEEILNATETLAARWGLKRRIFG